MLPLDTELWAAIYRYGKKSHVVGHAEGDFIGRTAAAVMEELVVWGEDPKDYEIIPVKIIEM